MHTTFYPFLPQVVEQLPTLLTYSSHLVELITTLLLQIEPLSRGCGRVISTHPWLIDQNISVYERQDSRGANLNVSNRTNSFHYAGSAAAAG